MIFPREVRKRDHNLPCESSSVDTVHNNIGNGSNGDNQHTTACSSAAAFTKEILHLDTTDSVKGEDSSKCFMSESSHRVSDQFLAWTLSGLLTCCADLSSSTAAPSSLVSSHSVFVNHAVCPQAHLDREDRILWREPSGSLDSHSAGKSFGGAGAYSWSSLRCAEGESHVRTDQGREAQGRPADPSPDQVPPDLDRPRDHQAALCPGMPRSHDGLSPFGNRCAGVRQVQRHDLQGCPDSVPTICGVDHSDLPGEWRTTRRVQLAPEALCSMVSSTERGDQDEGQDQHPSSQGQEGLQGFESARDGNHLGFLVQHGATSFGSRDGEGALRGGDGVRCRVPHPRVGSGDPCPAAPSEGQEVSSSSAPVDQQRSSLSKSLTQSGTVTSEAVKTALTSREQNHIKSQVSDRFETDWCHLVNYQRLVFLEVCCSPESVLTSTCLEKLGPGSAERISYWNGGDIETKEGRKYIKKVLREKRPMVSWFSPECGPYSPMQRLNQKTPQQVQTLEEKRKHARDQYEGVLECAIEAHSLGLCFLIELSERCEAWKQEWVQKLQKLGVHFGVCHGCQVDLRNTKGELLKKGWRLCSNREELVRHMTLECTQDHQHGLCEGESNCRRTAYYTPMFAKRVISHIQKENHCLGVIGELVDGIPQQHSLVNHGDDGIQDLDVENHEGQEGIPPMSREEVFKNMKLIRRIHSATGHCSNKYLYKALKRRGAHSGILRLVENFRCPVCEENKRVVPRNKSTLNEIPPKWCQLQADVGEWQHPSSGESWKFLLAIDEGSRFRVGRSLGSGKGNSASAQTLLDFYESQWLPVFGKPSSFRLDPGGPWRSTKLDEYMAERGIILETIPAESHWQISLIERAIQTTKGMLTKIISECPELRFEELLARTLWAQNSHDQYLGFSPLQHAFGRNPDVTGCLFDSSTNILPILTESGISAEFGRDVKAMIEAERAFLDEQAKWRLARAQDSGSRKIPHFFPGDLVFYWRKQIPKSEGLHPFNKGKYIGPARVLATETRVDANNEVRPGSIVWLYRADRLIKASPQQLRPASDRESALEELSSTPQPLPWTVSGILKDSSRQVFEDISGDWDSQGLEDMALEDDLPLLEEEARPPGDVVMRDVPDESSSSSSTKRKPPWPAPTHRARVKTSPPPVLEKDPEDILVALSSSTPSAHLAQQEACLAIEVDLPSGHQAKNPSWIRDLDAFLVKQLKKNHVEVVERHLTPEEKEQFSQAKGVEVKNFILAKAFEQLPDSQRPDMSQVLKMRWVLTWKVNPDTQAKKAKARAVILGYLDPDYERRPSTSPTVTRTSRQLFLQMAASFHFEIEKGDVSGAFLQGREFQRQVLCQPLPEICEALKLPSGSVTRLTRAAYGLVEAPLEWYLTVNAFLEELGFLRQQSDPCVWSLFAEDQSVIGWVCGHVDDFLFAGSLSDPRWIEIRKRIQDRFKWGEWERNNFTQCGVKIQRLENGSFSLSQPDYSEQIAEIFMTKKRWNETDSPATPSEKQQMRSVLGAISWHAGQLAMDLSAPVGLLLSKVNSATVLELVQTNKLLRQAKVKKGLVLMIHPIKIEELMVTTWVDASYANRPDGSSTKGVLVGCTSTKILQGSLEEVSPIYWSSSKITRVCRSSASAETRAAVDGEDQMFAVRFQLAEFLVRHANVWDCDATVRSVPGALISDSKNVYDRVSQTMLTLKGAEKRSDIETLCLKEAMSHSEVQIRWVNGDSQLANSLTKENESHQIHLFLSRHCRWRIIYDEELLSGKRRKQLGLNSLQQQHEQASCS